jgi:hypothetical protein
VGDRQITVIVSPATREKWTRQWAKLNAAITARDLPLVADLVAGCIRAWAALDAEAVAAGHPKLDPDAWEFQHSESGRVYRICKTLSHARVPARPGTITVTLEEMITLFDTRHRIYAEVASKPAQAAKTEPFDFAKGDKLPF